MGSWVMITAIWYKYLLCFLNRTPPISAAL
jgi:hypothetical protein